MPIETRLLGRFHVKVPVLGSPPTYSAFLNTFLNVRTNRKAFVVLEKHVLDAEYERLLRERLQHDEASLVKYMQEVKYLNCKNLKTRKPTVAPRQTASQL